MKHDHEALRAVLQEQYLVSPNGYIDRASLITGIPRSTVDSIITRKGWRGTFIADVPVRNAPGVPNAIKFMTPNLASYETELSQLTGKTDLELPPRPFVADFVPYAERSDKEWLTAFLYGDSHHPFQDERALAVVRSIAEDSQPDVLVHMGDLVDCYSISAFDRNPERMQSLQQEIDSARSHLLHMREAVPAARFVLLEGNHEDRLRRLIWKLEGPARMLTSLRAFQEALSWPNLLQLGGLGIEFYPYGREQTRANILPKFILKHGNVVRKWSGWTAKAEWERYGKSGASGHTHRKGVFYHKKHDGNTVWIEVGCTCDLDQEYAPDPDWQQGCALIHFNKATGAFAIEDVYIHNGNAMWRQKEYTA